MDREQGDWKIDPAGSQDRMWVVEVDRVSECARVLLIALSAHSTVRPWAHVLFILPFPEWGPVILLLLGPRH